MISALPAVQGRDSQRSIDTRQVRQLEEQQMTILRLGRIRPQLLQLEGLRKERKSQCCL